MGTFGAALWGGGGTGGGANIGVSAASLIAPAYRIAGISMKPGVGPNDDMHTEAVGELSRMVGSWNCDRPKIFTVAIDAFNLTGQKAYLVGTGAQPQTINGVSYGAFDMQRPQEIQNGVIGLGPAGTNGLVRMPPMQQLTDDQWARISLQDIAGAVPLNFYYDGSYDPATGYGLIYLWPQSASGYSVEWYTWQLLPTIQTVNDLIALPPGYESAIVYNLAVRLAALNPRDSALAPDAPRLARESLAAIEKRNAPTPPPMTSDFRSPKGGGGHWDYRVGFSR